jgi:hypothetical protein
VFRTLRRLTVASLRAAEAVALSIGRRPWKIDKFNRLIQPDILTAVKSIRSAHVIVGIPFHNEAGNIAALVEMTQRDLELRTQNAAIVIVGERRTRSVLMKAALPPSSARVKVVTLFKPFGFAQRPGLTRRSWSHWAILQISNRLRADVVFIDADVRNSQGWVNQYLDAIQHRGAGLAVANYIRRFDEDDAIVHIWDRLIFGAVFRKWIAFRHGGDYAISHKLLPGILADVSIMRERAYTMDSAVMAHVVRRSGRVEPVWLSAKEHEPITRLNLFNRLQTLVQSVFDDVDSHLPVVLALSGKAVFVQPPDIPTTPVRQMRDLIGLDFRQDLHRDMATRFHAAADDIRQTLGPATFERLAAIANQTLAEQVVLSPRHWSNATIRFLAHYVRSRDRAKKARFARSCVPVLEAGMLSFLNRTYDLTYAEAFRCLDTEYLPAFQHTWESLSRRLVLYRLALLRRWPVRAATRLTNTIRRLPRALSRNSGPGSPLHK